MKAFKFLHIGIISELPRKSLPAIAGSVGLNNAQSLHHFLQYVPWQVEGLRSRRLGLIKQLVGARSIVLCIDETGDKKAGKTTPRESLDKYGQPSHPAYLLPTSNLEYGCPYLSILLVADYVAKQYIGNLGKTANGIVERECLCNGGWHHLSIGL